MAAVGEEGGRNVATFATIAFDRLSHLIAVSYDFRFFQLASVFPTPNSLPGSLQFQNALRRLVIQWCDSIRTGHTRLTRRRRHGLPLSYIDGQGSIQLRLGQGHHHLSSVGACWQVGCQTDGPSPGLTDSSYFDHQFNEPRLLEVSRPTRSEE
jgi:hypothetical protein